MSKLITIFITLILLTVTGSVYGCRSSQKSTADIIANSPHGLITGTDNNLWCLQNNKILKFSPYDGKITAYTAVNSQIRLGAIAATSDGHIWFTEENSNKIGELSPATGKIKEYPIPTAISESSIAAGPDGNLWITENNLNRIGKLSPLTGNFGEYAVPSANAGLDSIVSDNADSLWFTQAITHKIGKIAVSSGTIIEFMTAYPPTSIIIGPGGSPWFTEPAGNNINRLSAQTGIVTGYEIPTDNSDPTSIVAGPDGNLWFTETQGNKIGKISPATGSIVEYDIPYSTFTGSHFIYFGPDAITAGADRNLWFTYNNGTINKFSPVTGKFTAYPVPAH